MAVHTIPGASLGRWNHTRRLISSPRVPYTVVTPSHYEGWIPRLHRPSPGSVDGVLVAFCTFRAITFLTFCHPPCDPFAEHVLHRYWISLYVALWWIGRDIHFLFLASLASDFWLTLILYISWKMAMSFELWVLMSTRTRQRTVYWQQEKLLGHSGWRCRGRSINAWGLYSRAM
ncbi:hypothetical protein EJ05DRAFT_345024 [Pseudovirgaria hyperparasitica]|uniref:Uncharacterized protein n=1 Tax=Pseudovirgaria hyperparasitica TaxID=470096 RepID=A0A6A6W986_9PEZI|nr:uncharacterized protein EJ05DRAFT_345024 [Pseudovirgaria hyperparasitica]KAF2759412.1 hypothetical protein EJ05DRAFT_345024 [Pseudovirgaria hyperparasitica]